MHSVWIGWLGGRPLPLGLITLPLPALIPSLSDLPVWPASVPASHDQINGRYLPRALTSLTQPYSLLLLFHEDLFQKPVLVSSACASPCFCRPLSPISVCRSLSSWPSPCPRYLLWSLTTLTQPHLQFAHIHAQSVECAVNEGHQLPHTRHHLVPAWGHAEKVDKAMRPRSLPYLL